MAKARIEAALGEYGDLTDFVATTGLNPVGVSTTALTVEDAQGDGFTFTGTGLGINPLTGAILGTFTGLRVFSSTDATLMTITDFSFGAAELYQIFNFSGIGVAVLAMFAEADQITGSSVGDKLFGFSGNDNIRGGGGDDLIGGSVGRDKLWGERGADVFLFVAGDGKDQIMDFTDTGGRADDQIGITRKMYNSMTIEDTAFGLTLNFGNKGEIAVKGWEVANVDVTDFLFA